MAQTVQILRTTTTTPPATLLPGAFSAILAPTATKLYIGSPTGNLLLLSSDPTDIPVVGQHYIPTNGGIISGTSPGTLQISRNVPVLAPVGVISAFYVVGGDGEQVAMGIDGIAAIPRFYMRRANGTGGALSHLNLNDTIGTLAWAGFGAGFGAATAQISAIASENWTSLANGTNLQFSTTPGGATVAANNMTLDGGGNLTITRQLNAGSVLVTGTNQGFIQLTRNAVPTPLPVTGVAAIWAVGNDGELPLLGVDSFGAGSTSPQIMVRRANGTGAARTAITQDQQLGTYNFGGYGTTSFGPNVARIMALASETFTDTAQGTFLQFWTTAPGGIVQNNVAVLNQGLTLGTPGLHAADNGRGSLIANQNAVSPIVPAISAAVQALGADSGNVVVELVGSNGTPVVMGRRSAGTLAAPAATIANTGLLQVQVRGRGATGWSGNRGSLAWNTSETWTDTAQGTQIQLTATPIGTVATRTIAQFGQGLALGTPPAVGTDTAFGALICNANAAVPVAPFYGVGAQIIGADNVQTSLELTSFSSAVGTTNRVLLRHANGTGAAPTATLQGYNLGAISGGGYGATAWGPARATIQFIATENWTDTAQGGLTQFWTTPTGTVAAALQAVLSQGLTLGIASATLGADNGRGSLIANLNPTATPPATALAAGNTGVQIVGVDGQPAALDIIAAAGIPQTILRRSSGSIASPTQTNNSDALGAYSVRGYGASAWSGTTGTLQFTATETWTNANHGTQAQIFTTPNGGGGVTANLTLDGSGNLTIVGGTATKAGGGSWVAPSDPRLKHPDVRPYHEGLDAILALDPIVYRYSGRGGLRDDGREYVGLDADAVADVFPSLVGEMEYQPIERDEDGEIVELGEVETYRTIDSSELIYCLINAVKELHAKLQGSVH